MYHLAHWPAARLAELYPNKFAVEKLDASNEKVRRLLREEEQPGIVAEKARLLADMDVKFCPAGLLSQFYPNKFAVEKLDASNEKVRRLLREEEQPEIVVEKAKPEIVVEKARPLRCPCCHGFHKASACYIDKGVVKTLVRWLEKEPTWHITYMFNKGCVACHQRGHIPVNCDVLLKWVKQLKASALLPNPMPELCTSELCFACLTIGHRVQHCPQRRLRAGFLNLRQEVGDSQRGNYLVKTGSCIRRVNYHHKEDRIRFQREQASASATK
uniref:CCHC-type domain-containing protein n=1 Tax=Globodera pallida TaxID=36090 RepID=A0A183BSU5_GLOPA